MPLPLLIAAKTAKDLMSAARVVRAEWQALPDQERDLLAADAEDVKRLTAELASTLRPGRSRGAAPTRSQGEIGAELRAALTRLSTGMRAPAAAAMMATRSRRARLVVNVAGRAIERSSIRRRDATEPAPLSAADPSNDPPEGTAISELGPGPRNSVPSEPVESMSAASQSRIFERSKLYEDDRYRGQIDALIVGGERVLIADDSTISEWEMGEPKLKYNPVLAVATERRLVLFHKVGRLKRTSPTVVSLETLTSVRLYEGSHVVGLDLAWEDRGQTFRVRLGLSADRKLIALWTSVVSKARDDARRTVAMREDFDTWQHEEALRQQRGD